MENPHEYREKVYLITAYHDVDPTVIPSRGRPAVLYEVKKAIANQDSPGSADRMEHTILRYTQGSSSLNKALARLPYDRQFDPRAPSTFSGIVIDLVRAIRNLFNPSKNSRVFRGCSLTDQQLQVYQERVGCVIQWNAFSSTSLSEKVAEEFSERGNSNQKTPVVFEIRRHASHPTAAYIAEYADENSRWQKEVLMIPGCRFKILRIEENTYPMKIVLKEIVLKSHQFIRCFSESD